MSKVGLGQVISWYITTVAAGIFVAGRLAHQWKRFGNLTVSDGFVILAWAGLVADLGIQQHMWNKGVAEMGNASPADLMEIMRMIIPGSTLYVTSLWSIKVALVLFYKKLAPRGLNLQMIYNATLGFLAVTWLVIFFDIIFQCFPNNKRWSQDPNYQCDPYQAEVNYWITILLNIFTDVLIICLPISMVLKLQMKRKQKLGVVATFALGFFVVIASIVRAYYSKKNETMLTCTVSMVETAIAIIASCLPALRSVFLGKKTQTGTSAYGKHYELSSVQRGVQRSRGTTTVIGASNNGLDSEDELVKGDRPSPGESGVDWNSNDKSIRVDTTVQISDGSEAGRSV
ncbi:hypothetical protein F5Y18DRAFT_440267 [Xylariaceae sp. FL1019]|nr:hypothetical protein F5Y18DRAFT_440267 [Xylariaceae sp. FL1019]